MTQTQTGDNNTATMDLPNVKNNMGTITQIGNGNMATSDFLSNNNSSTITQNGNGNMATVTQQ
jgi:hypothetical protein